MRHGGAGGCVAARITVCILALCSIALGDDKVGLQPPPAAQPRIVNLYNFIRNSDYRVPNSEQVLFDCTEHQIHLITQAHLPATWALQYDALINPKYQQLLKTQLPANNEIAAWWELPRVLVEKAGIKWRGRHDWDSTANIGFSPGYTPDERRKLVDVYMADFKSIFGRYPQTVGSWYIDEITLAYMADRYGIVASCNCKDQIGTDGYTLWGGYWNQAYYPSRLNAYMPAQTRAGQIDVPIFRMLGSDPIYQYGSTQGMFTLEPVYPEAGGSSRWVNWFFNDLVNQPSLAFGYVQAGQENSFGWDAMKTGLTLQVAELARRAKTGEIRIETLADSGRWFHQHFPVTPATAVVYLNDWRQSGHRSIWYDSRFYRANLFWADGQLNLRDLHLFDQSVVSSTHDTPLQASTLVCHTLPVMDAAMWQGDGPIGMFPVLAAPGSNAVSLRPAGEPTVREQSPKVLEVAQPLRTGGTLSISFGEAGIAFSAVNDRGQPLVWGIDMVGGAGQRLVVQSLKPDAVSYRAEGTRYQLRLSAGTCHPGDHGVIHLLADSSGKLQLALGADDADH